MVDGGRAVDEHVAAVADGGRPFPLFFFDCCLWPSRRCGRGRG